MAAVSMSGVDSAAAQGSIFASLSGAIRDASDAVVPGATVILVMTSTNAEQRTSTGEIGRYVFARLTPGTYTLSVEKSGFRTTTVDNVVLAVNDALTRDVRLEA